jgi:hypothetical protein
MYIMNVAPKRITTEEKNLLRRNIPISVPSEQRFPFSNEFPLIYANSGSGLNTKEHRP